MNLSQQLKKLTALCFIITFISCGNDEAEPTIPTPDPTPEPTPVGVSPIQVTTIVSLTAHDGLALDKSGNLYASSYGGSEVYKVTPQGETSLFISQQSGAAGITFNDEGIMYLSRYNVGDIVSISPDGEVLDIVAESIKGPIALDFDSEGNLYTNNNVGFHITKVDNETGQVSNYVTHEIPNTSSIIIDDEDNLYISNYNDGVILKVDRNLGISQFATIPTQGTGAFSGIGFLIYSNESFYATAIGDGKVYKISKEGVVELIAGTGESGKLDGTGDIATFATPNAIVATKSGDTLFVAQEGGIRMITGY